MKQPKYKIGDIVKDKVCGIWGTVMDVKRMPFISNPEPIFEYDIVSTNGNTWKLAECNMIPFAMSPGKMEENSLNKYTIVYTEHLGFDKVSEPKYMHCVTDNINRFVEDHSEKFKRNIHFVFNGFVEQNKALTFSR